MFAAHARRLPLAALLATLGACAPDSAPRLYPAPTEHVLDPDAEGRQTSLRKAWFEHRHQAGPGVDWRALERANGEAQIEKRNRIGAVAAHQNGKPERWIERGSQNLAGRVHAAFPAPDGLSLYLGTALGGTWQGNLDGTGWAPFGDNLYGGAHHVAAVTGATSSDPDVVMAATDGGILHVTRDHGATWEIPFGLGSLQEVRRVLVTSDGSEVVFVLRKRSSGFRLVRSTDRMANFLEVYNLGSFPGDAWIRRDGSNDLYLMTGTGLVKSTDLGSTWTSAGPLPASGSRAELTGSEAGAPRLWCVMSGSNLYRSDNAGASWTLIGALSDYWSALNASITNADLFLYGGVEAHKTTNAGASFAVINTWGAYYGNPAARLHADIQGIDVFTSTNPSGEIWYISTDGGLYRSTNGLSTVQNLSLSGLRVSQYYTTHTSSADTDHVVAGAQDQGYQRASLAPTGTTNLTFSQLISGDYGHLSSGDGDHGALFSTYPGFILAHIGETSPALYQVSFPPSEDHAWMPPVVGDPLNPNHFFFCASHLYRYTKSGASSWTRTQWSTKDFGVSAGEYLSALVFSPLDVLRAYAVTDRGRLYRSIDRGLTWTLSVSGGPGGQYFYGTALLASRADVDTVYVGGSGYSGPAVYRSTDGGVTYQAWSDGLPPTLVYCLGEARDGSGQLFAGTETAAYARGPADPAWTDITDTSAPITIYWSVEAVPHEDTMRFGTYGRGIWDYRLEEPAIARSRNGSGLNPQCLTSINPPRLGSAWSVSIDPSLVPGTLRTRLVVREQPTSGTILPRGELLATGARYLAASQPADPDGNVYTFPIPGDASLVGVTATAQALLVGGGTRFCNALDLVLGY
jgi:photosystem II stability/assembly factor-like uncharacterized protein